MAKRAASEGGINVSAAIREYRNTHRKAKPKAIAQALAEEKGINVSPAYVSTILSTDRRKKKKGKRGAAGDEVAVGRRGRRPASDKFDDVINDLQAARQLVEKLGSIDKARAALAALAKLQ
jgi:hypothetical protein